MSHPGVRSFFRHVEEASEPVFLSAITIGELRRGVELMRRRGDLSQYKMLHDWLATIMAEYRDHILPFDTEAAEWWGILRARNPANEIDKQIAAIAMVNDLTLVTRNEADFRDTPVRLLNPFEGGI